MAAIQQDIIFQIEKFGSMNSFTDPVAIEDNQLAFIGNFLYEGNKLVARTPHKRVTANTTTGIWSNVGGGTMRTSSATYKVYGLSNGTLWQTSSDTATPVQLTLASTNALTAGNRISCTQHLNLFYIVDGVNLLEWDPAGSTLTSRTGKLPSDITVPTFILSWRTRLIVTDADGHFSISKSDTAISSAAPYDTTAGAFSDVVARGDGLSIINVTAGERILAISKQLSRDRVTNMTTCSGTSSSNFELREASPSTGFLGTSAVQIGSDVFGLTPSGFRFLSVVSVTGESTQTAQNVVGANFDTKKVPDYLDNYIQGINYTYANKITGIYNDIEDAYYCSIPYGSTITKNNLVIRVDFTNDDIRFTLFTNTNAQWFYKANGYIYFIDHLAQIWKMNDDTQTSYEEDEYHKLIITKAYNFNQIATTYRAINFSPEFKIYKPFTANSPKNINVFFNGYRTAPDSGQVQFETNIGGTLGDPNAGRMQADQWISSGPNAATRYDMSISDLATMDTRLSNYVSKELPITQNVERVQGVISDQQDDTNGYQRFEVRSILFKGKPESEKKK